MSAVQLIVREEPALAPHECRALGCRPTLTHFSHHVRYSTPKTSLSFATVYEGDRFLGTAPVIRIRGQKSTEMLRPEVRRWLGPLLGFSSRRTTCLIDTSFLAFDYSSPFLCPVPTDHERVRDAIVDHLQQKRGVRVVWVTEPQGDTTWARLRNYDSFATLPMVSAELKGHTSVNSYLASLSKKRRKNWRADRRTFELQRGTFEHLAPPLDHDTLRQMHGCLLESARRNSLCVPYADVMNDLQAFSSQKQHAIVARQDGKIVGFFSWFPNGPVMQQCHGGFDHAGSQQVNAYPNLINAAIEYAITHGFERVSLGPLNNEVKRRAATQLLPMTSSVWCRDGLTRWFMRHLFLKNFQVYRGEPGSTAGLAIAD